MSDAELLFDNKNNTLEHGPKPKLDPRLAQSLGATAELAAALVDAPELVELTALAEKISPRGLVWLVKSLGEGWQGELGLDGTDASLSDIAHAITSRLTFYKNNDPKDVAARIEGLLSGTSNQDIADETDTEVTLVARLFNSVIGRLQKTVGQIEKDDVPVRPSASMVLETSQEYMATGKEGVQQAMGQQAVRGEVAADPKDEDRLAWQRDSLCAQTDPEAFFPEKGGSTRDAKKVCTGCEVRENCLLYALENDVRFGIWGGLSERERRKLKNKQAA